MKTYICEKHKTIFFWTPKSGVTSIVEMILHLELNKVTKMYKNSDDDTHSIFNNLRYKNDQKVKSFNFKDCHKYKKILFIRNPYHRVISCFLDKYVDPNSPTPSANPGVKNFKSFVNLLNETKLKKDQMVGLIDYEHFTDTTFTDHYDFFSNFNHSDLRVIELPETALPEGKLTHDVNLIQCIYKWLGIETKFKEIEHLYTNEYSIQNYKKNVFIQNRKKLFKKNFYDKTISELRLYRGDKFCRTLDYNCFYTQKLKDIIFNLYKREFIFLESLGYFYE